MEITFSGYQMLAGGGQKNWKRIVDVARPQFTYAATIAAEKAKIERRGSNTSPVVTSYATSGNPIWADNVLRAKLRTSIDKMATIRADEYGRHLLRIWADTPESDLGALADVTEAMRAVCDDMRVWDRLTA